MEPVAPVGLIEGQYDALSGLLGQGLDPASLQPQQQFDEGGLRDGAQPPGYGKPLNLSEGQLSDIGREYTEICDNYDSVMADRWKVEEAIRAAYAQRTDPIQTGIRPGDANYCSEVTMTLVDQATARIVTNIISVEPLARCIPIAGGETGDLAIATAQAAEHFLQNYGQRVVKFPQLLARAVHRACKVGTAVLYGKWVVEQRKTFSYAAHSSAAIGKKTEVGRLRFDMPPNRLVKIWPPTLSDWQDDYQLVGHDTYLTRGQFRRMAADLKLPKELAERIENTAGQERDAGSDQSLAEQDIERRVMSHKSDELIRITELWCHDVLPGMTSVDKYQLFLCRPPAALLLDRLQPPPHPGPSVLSASLQAGG